MRWSDRVTGKKHPNSFKSPPPLSILSKTCNSCKWPSFPMVALPLMCVHYSVQQCVSKAICGATWYSNTWCYSVQQYVVLLGTAICGATWYSNMWCYSVQQYVVLLGTAICLMLATSAPPDVCDATDGGDTFTMHYLGTAMRGATQYSNTWYYLVQQYVCHTGYICTP